MNTKETAQCIFDSLSERQIEAFITIFKPLAENNTMLNEELVTIEVELPKWLAYKADELELDLSEVLVNALKRSDMSETTKWQRNMKNSKKQPL